jgi:hypothetical protein
MVTGTAICTAAAAAIIMAGVADPAIITAGATTTITRPYSVPIKSERYSISLFDAFSSREPVPTSLENALEAFAFANHCPGKGEVFCE